MDSIVWQARTLLRAARAATLATAREGQPFASLVTPACTADLSVLMLLSGLSEHTAHLLADPRCAIMVTDDPVDANPQTAPRLSVIGSARPDPDPALRARWVARHPYAAFYADLGDFRVFRLRPAGGHFIGGFGAAHRLARADLVPDPAAIRAVAAIEAGLVARINAEQSDAIARIAGEGGWRLAAIDVDGCDLVRGETVRRIAWSQPVADAEGIRSELAHLAA